MAPLFEYKGLDPSGKNLKGTLEAENQKNARAKLKKQGILVTQIEEKSTASQSKKNVIPFFGGRVSGKEVASAIRQLASLVKANIPLVEALGALVDQSEHPRLKVILYQVRQDVNEGLSLSKAFGKHPKAFDHIVINMLEAGESSGTLGAVLLRLANLKEAQVRLRTKVTSSLMYPGIMMIVSFGLVLGIFTLIIPKLAKLFEDSRKPLPLLTKVIMSISNWLVDWWFLLIGGIVFSYALFSKYIKSPQGRARWDSFKLKLPIAGPLIRMVAVTRFSSTMATLLGSGVPILPSLSIAKNLVGNVPIEKAIGIARENITEGQSIAEPLRKSGEFPAIMIHMISIGEKTGELPEMLKNVAETYEEQVNTRIEGMTSLLEPLLIVLMGGIIAFIVFAVFTPLMDMMDLDQH